MSKNGVCDTKPYDTFETKKSRANVTT